MSISNYSITFVIQGPIVHQITKESCEKIRQHFVGAKILLSTWQGQPVESLDYDELLLNEDPGSSIVKFDKRNQPHKININRQIISTLNGLKRVSTEYAVKLRSDNTIHSPRILALYEAFPKSGPPLLPLENRILTTNLFAKEYVEGLATPFFFSDFFMFGKTCDLIEYWDQPKLEDYTYRAALSGKRQHASYPWPQLHIEQWLVVNFLKKHLAISLSHKYANTSGQMQLSREILAKHFIIAERSMINLTVPERLNQHEGFPYETYSFRRWQELYKQYCDADYVISGHLNYKISWITARILMIIKSGVKQWLRLRLCALKKTTPD